MTYIIKSEQANRCITTKDPLKDEAWGNGYFGVSDCIRIETPEPTIEDIEAIKVQCDIERQNRDDAIDALISGDTVALTSIRQTMSSNERLSVK